MAKQAIRIVITVLTIMQELVSPSTAKTYKVYEVVQEVKDLVVAGERNITHLDRKVQEPLDLVLCFSSCTLHFFYIAFVILTIISILLFFFPSRWLR